MYERAASSRPAWRVWLRRLAPWVVTVVVVLLLLGEHPPREIATEMRRGDAWSILPVALVLGVVILVAVSAWDWLVLGACAPSLRWWDVLRGKAACSTLMSLGYGFGHGAYGLWVARKTGIGAAAAAGTILYIAACDLAAVAIVASLSVALAEETVPGPARSLLCVGAPAAAAALVAAKVIGPRRPRRPPALFEAWRVVPPLRALASIAGRCLNIATMVVGTWAAARLFGLAIPLGVMATYLPIVLVVGSLPVNVAGFGAVQVAWLLFEPWAPGPQILAFQVLWHLFTVGALILRGLPFLRGVTAEIDRGAGDPG